MSEQTTIEKVSSSSNQRDENQLVTFNLGDEEFGFDIMSVQEIIRQPQFSRIPMAPTYVDGVANLRGMILPIIDTRSRFGLGKIPETDQTRVLVVDVEGNKTGLRVDRVRQVTRIQKKDVEPPPAVVREGISVDYLKGVVKLDGGKRIIMSLNPAAICKVQLQGGGLGQADAQKVSQQGEVPIGNEGNNQSIAQLVTFKLGAEEFAFHMESVREILRVERPSEVPNTPKHLLGLLTVRGSILPVIDLRILLGFPNLDSEVVAATVEVANHFGDWLKRYEISVGEGNAVKVSLEGPEMLRKWISTFNTSSQTLMEILSGVRVANDKLTRLLQVATGKNKLEQEIRPIGSEIVSLLEKFEGSIKDNIREDQRLIVVQSKGQLLALLVDKVREVLNMPKNQIDLPPQTAGSQNLELSGIAKLEGGKRLIMLLDAGKLIRDEDLQKLDGISQKTENVVAQNQAGIGEAKVQGEQQFVTFRLGDGEYGIPISKIQEIDRSSKMTRIPRTAEYVDGVTNLRGEIVPVINARKRFELEAKEADERTRVIIMDVNGTKTGLLVDSVREVLSLPVKDIAAPPTSLSTTIDRQYISGIAKVESGKRMIVLLDIEKIIQK